MPHAASQCIGFHAGGGMAKIVGIEGLTNDQINFELQRGAKFVFYQYCISVIVMAFRRSSDIYFIKEGESRLSKGLPWTLLSVLAGWWGIPWGPIFTVQALITNFRGGKDVTDQLLTKMRGTTAQGAAAGS
jgi:hypothetical protein